MSIFHVACIRLVSCIVCCLLGCMEPAPLLVLTFPPIRCIMHFLFYSNNYVHQTKTFVIKNSLSCWKKNKIKILFANLSVDSALHCFCAFFVYSCGGSFWCFECLCWFLSSSSSFELLSQCYFCIFAVVLLFPFFSTLALSLLSCSFARAARLIFTFV